MPPELRYPRWAPFTIRQLCLEFKCTPHAALLRGRGACSRPPARAWNRVYSYKDRARLQLILRGKAVNLSLAEIREILDLYDKNDGGATQNATALRKFRRAHRGVLERQRKETSTTPSPNCSAPARNLEESRSPRAAPTC